MLISCGAVEPVKISTPTNRTQTQYAAQGSTYNGSEAFNAPTPTTPDLTTYPTPANSYNPPASNSGGVINTLKNLFGGNKNNATPTTYNPIYPPTYPNTITRQMYLHTMLGHPLNQPISIAQAKTISIIIQETVIL